MTTTDLINGVLEREGGYVADPRDTGGATNWGITALTWGRYQGLGRQATRSEIKAITRDQAVAFYQREYVDRSPFKSITYEPLRVQMVDFGINSDNARATRWLQRVLEVPVTGEMDDRTKVALNRDRPALVNSALVAARIYMIDRACKSGDIDPKFEDGLKARALRFADIPT